MSTRTRQPDVQVDTEGPRNSTVHTGAILLVILGSLWCSLPLVLLLPAPAVASDSVPLGFQTRTQWNAWDPVTFPGKKATNYDFDTSTRTVCAHAQSAASGLARPFPGTLEKFPVLSWDWKIAGILDDGNAHRKSGDDYAARVYINFERTAETWSWWERTKASTYETFAGYEMPGQTLNFIWANRVPKLEALPSPYTDHAHLIPLRSGSDEARQWKGERINIERWYRKAFDGDPPPVQSVAIMTDSDNTRSTARACYRNIRLTSP